MQKAEDEENRPKKKGSNRGIMGHFKRTYKEKENLG
jgi:hypothetical protein